MINKILFTISLGSIAYGPEGLSICCTKVKFCDVRTVNGAKW